MSHGLSTRSSSGFLYCPASKLDLTDFCRRLGAERFMGSSGELQELVVVEGSKMLMDGSLDVRKHAKHLWGELGQHSRTEGLLKQHLSGSQLREVSGIVEGLR